jgi:lipoprotein-releasing system permease protein
VGLVGSFAGSGLGALLVTFFAGIAKNPDGTSIFQVVLEPYMFITASLVATVTGLIAAAAPSIRAARLDPVAAIRYG